jgi:hypothetical protein
VDDRKTGHPFDTRWRRESNPMNKSVVGATVFALVGLTMSVPSQAESIGPVNGSPFPMTAELQACFSVPGTDGFVQNNCTFAVAWDVQVPRKSGSQCTGSGNSGCLVETSVSVTTTGQPGGANALYRTRLYGFDSRGAFVRASAYKDLTFGGTGLVHTITLVNNGLLIMEHEMPPNGKMGGTIY